MNNCGATNKYMYTTITLKGTCILSYITLKGFKIFSNFFPIPSNISSPPEQPVVDVSLCQRGPSGGRGHKLERTLPSHKPPSSTPRPPGPSCVAHLRLSCWCQLAPGRLV